MTASGALLPILVASTRLLFQKGAGLNKAPDDLGVDRVYYIIYLFYQQLGKFLHIGGKIPTFNTYMREHSLNIDYPI
jgi:hypothetical protein